jgi:hypothetical protein
MKRLAVLLSAFSLAAPAGAPAQQPVLAEWVESNPFFEQNKIALGYPVPEPVDTPLPFDGFRTYAGLHTRHMDLAATTPWVHAENIGTTRAGRTIWAYRLGDADLETIHGLPEPATLTNGGIHAREWQTPEVVTGILELLATHPGNDHFYGYLRDNLNMIVIPSLNIDGFLQTQRYPTLNYLGADPDYPDSRPRDGRMRRKNMLDADENLSTQFDLLNGVDLNRNNGPFWSVNPSRSSPDPHSILHHGSAPASEPEIQALDAAAHLGPIERLRLYTDVHSFSQELYWSRDGNERLAMQVELLLGIFSDHHRQLPGQKFYYYPDRYNVAYSGFGMTNEYMYHTYQVPAFGLEVEPSSGHPNLPGCGADYGGLANNCHDGFILPDSEIRRVREGLAQSFAALYYRQAGPPSIQAMRFIDRQTGAVVYEAEWDVVDGTSRSLYQNQIQPLQLDRDYTFWLSFNKPMRWRVDGLVAPFPGQSADTLEFDAQLWVGGAALDIQNGGAAWLNQPGGAPDGYQHYADDALHADFRLNSDQQNLSAINGETAAIVRVSTTDMTRFRLDANPATVADLRNGAWVGYENSSGFETDSGGTDMSITLSVTDAVLSEPFVLEPGIASAWYDEERTGEGFIIEMLAGGVVVLYWFTYDGAGEQDWYIAVGEVRGNRILFPRLLQVTGGVFGPGFDSGQISEVPAGSASFLFSGCDSGSMDWHIGNRRGRQNLSRITRLMGLDCGQPRAAPDREEARYSGSWYDRTHAGEGFTVQVLDDGTILVYWFSFGPDGQRRWFFGAGEIADGKLRVDNMMTTRGGIFGAPFDPAAVEEVSWGSLELEVSCDGGTATYASSEAGFGSGQLNIVKLTSMDGLECGG